MKEYSVVLPQITGLVVGSGQFIHLNPYLMVLLSSCPPQISVDVFLQAVLYENDFLRLSTATEAKLAEGLGDQTYSTKVSEVEFSWLTHFLILPLTMD